MDRKIAVLADIHSNHIALEACLEEARKRDAEEYLSLGDYLGELAYPEKTMEILDHLAKQYPCVFIRGNKEAVIGAGLLIFRPELNREEGRI